jgi:hypothetical protein
MQAVWISFSRDVGDVDAGTLVAACWILVFRKSPELT